MIPHKFLLIPLLTFVLFFSSCEKVIEIDPLDSPSQLVLNGVPSAEKPFFVYFANSHFFLDTSNNHPVSNVDMLLRVNGNDYRPTHADLCRYLFNYIPQEDDSLSIRVQAGDRLVTSSTYVPRMPQISNLAAYIDSSSTFNLLVVNFNVTDPANYPNYYRFGITQRDSGSIYIPYFDYSDTIDTTFNTFFFCFDKALTSPNAAATEALGGYLYTQLLTTDANIDGKTHNASIMVILLRDTNEIQPYIHQYSLSIECVTPDRYRYLQDIDEINSMMSLIAEPPEVYSNVNGALGIFAGTAKRTFPLITISDGQPINTKINIPLTEDPTLISRYRHLIPPHILQKLKNRPTR
jgi:hypothetical protein